MYTYDGFVGAFEIGSDIDECDYDTSAILRSTSLSSFIF